MVLRWVALSLLLALPAFAADSEELAARASEVHASQCSDVAAGKATAAAEAVGEVGPVLAEVSRTFDKAGAPFLLYWRGLLNQCLGMDERALTDLEQFVAEVGADTAYAGQIADAKKRLRRLAKDEPVGPAPAGGGIALGVGLLGAGGALGGLSAWQGQLVLDAQGRYDAGTRPWGETVEQASQGKFAEDRHRALLAAGVAAGVAGAVALVVTGLTGEQTPTVALLPTEEGLVLSVGGTW